MLQKKLNYYFKLLAVILFFSILHANASAAEIDDITKAIEEKGARWYAEENEISKLPPEVRKKYNGLLPRTSTALAATLEKPAISIQIDSLPATLDWRNMGGKNYVTEVRDQGGCRSCWAFSTTAALESRSLISRDTPGVDIDNAEQILLSCSGAGSCEGGGWIDMASDYIRDTGLALETCYQYTGTNGSCSNACANWQPNAYKIYNWLYPGDSVDAMKNALNLYGPLVTTMDVYSDYYSYRGGIYSYTYGTYQGGHGVLVVGYDDAGQYFIVKNSWGKGWGESGYFRIAYSQFWPYSVVNFGLQTIAYVEGGNVRSDPVLYNFGNTNLGTTSPQSFSISNIGTHYLWFGTISLTGANQSEFLKTIDTCSGQYLMASMSCSVQILFSPTTAGPKSATLNIPSNDPDMPILGVSLSGTGRPTLTVTKSGTGSGTVTSSPAGISCGEDCFEPYDSGTPVTLTAMPSSNSSFAGWSGGGCSGTNACTITMNANTTVTATFTLLPPTAGFSAFPTVGNAPLEVFFTDLSSNMPSSWFWTFGDGNTSTLQNPSHTYEQPGNYSVSLTVYNAGGQNTKSVTDYISVQSCSLLPVRIAGANPQYFSSIQQAYNAAADQDIIEVQGIDFTEDLNIDEVLVTLQGGFDCSYTNRIRDTNLMGTITMNGGQLAIRKFILRN